MGENSPADDSDDVLSLTVQTPASEKPAGKAGAKQQAGAGDKKSGANRRELRQQTASQSAELNFSVAAEPDVAQSANAKNQPRSAAKEVDAEELLEEANAEGINKSLAARRSKFRKAAQPGDDKSVDEGFGIGVPTFGNYNPAEAGKTNSSGGMGARGPAVTRGGAGFDYAVSQDAIQEVSGWTAAGGLSLDIAVPQEGQKLTFSKSGGGSRQ